MRQDSTLLVPMKGDLNDKQVREFQSDLLDEVSRSDIERVLLDISNLDSIDLFLSRLIVETVNMIQLMDTDVVVVGMKPAVAITLTEMEIGLEGVKTAPTVDSGLRLLERTRGKPRCSS